MGHWRVWPTVSQVWLDFLLKVLPIGECGLCECGFGSSLASSLGELAQVIHGPCVVPSLPANYPTPALVLLFLPSLAAAPINASVVSDV